MALMQSKTMNSTLLSAYQFVLIKVMAGFFKSYGINTLVDTLNQPIKRGLKVTVFFVLHRRIAAGKLTKLHSNKGPGSVFLPGEISLCPTTAEILWLSTKSRSNKFNVSY